MQKQPPQRVEKNTNNHRFWFPEWLQNPSKIAPGSLSESAGAQDAPKNSLPESKKNKTEPRALLWGSLALLWGLACLRIWWLAPAVDAGPAFEFMVSVRPTLLGATWGVLQGLLVLAMTALHFTKAVCIWTLWGLQGAPNWLIIYLAITSAQWIRHAEPD